MPDLNKKWARIVIVTLMAITISVAVVFYVSQNLQNEEYLRPNTGFVVQGFKGDPISTWGAWRLPMGEQLHVHIINPPELTKDREEAIWSAVLSEETILVDNAYEKSGDLAGLYYKGWLGALKDASKTSTKFYIPHFIHTHVTDLGEGDVLIRLNEQKNPHDFNAFTKAIVDEDNFQIIKSEITIYDVNNLTDEQIATIVRHELGHALGLSHSTEKNDLMNEKIGYEFISQCDVNELIELFNGKKTGAYFDCKT